MTSDMDAVLAVANNDTNPIEGPAQAAQALLEPPRPPITPRSDTMEEPTLWPEIRSIIDHDNATAPRSLQKTIGPSELGTTCVHCLAAKLAGWEKHENPAWLPYIGTCVHEHMERLFDRLNGLDEYMVSMLSDDNTPELVERWRTEYRVTVGHIHGLAGGQDITGSIDLWDRKTHATIDWKIVGNTTLTKVRAHGPSQQYRVQASLYGIGLTREGETVDRSCIYFLPRNKSTLRQALPVEMRFDPKPGLWALSRAQLLVNLMDVIEQADGPDIRDAWIHMLPSSPDDCFQCRACTWPDQSPLPELDGRRWPAVPDKWLALTPLVESEYQPAN